MGGQDILIPMELVPTKSSDTPYAQPLIFVGFGGSGFFDNEKSLEEKRHINFYDCNQVLSVLIGSRVFPDRALQRWQYYTRKNGHFLLEKGIAFDDGHSSDLFIESGSDTEESDENTSGSDDSEDDSEDNSESGSESD